MKAIGAFLIAWVALTAPAVAASSAAAGSDQPTPRESATVNGNVVRLGDLFENAGDRAQIAVAYAPAPGKRAYFDSRWLAKVAKRYGLAWEPVSYEERVVVERESVLVKRNLIEERIRDALGQHGLSGDTRIELTNPMVRMHVIGDGDGQPEVVVEDISYDERTGRFNAIVAANPDRATVQRLRVTGRAYKSLRVPVLRKPIAPGEVIGKDDVDWIEMRAERVQPSTVVDLADLTGKTAKRGLRAGMPVNFRDVAKPVLVTKNSVVTMVFRADRMTLTTQGKALEDGSEGESIRVANTHSKQTVEAVVIGAGRVAVGRPTPLAMN